MVMSIAAVIILVLLLATGFAVGDTLIYAWKSKKRRTRRKLDFPERFD
jgi:hypothetical protein